MLAFLDEAHLVDNLCGNALIFATTAVSTTAATTVIPAVSNAIDQFIGGEDLKGQILDIPTGILVLIDEPADLGGADQRSILGRWGDLASIHSNCGAIRQDLACPGPRFLVIVPLLVERQTEALRLVKFLGWVCARPCRPIRPQFVQHTMVVVLAQRIKPAVQGLFLPQLACLKLAKMLTLFFQCFADAWLIEHSGSGLSGRETEGAECGFDAQFRSMPTTNIGRDRLYHIAD